MAEFNHQYQIHVSLSISIESFYYLILFLFLKEVHQDSSNVNIVVINVHKMIIKRIEYFQITSISLRILTQHRMFIIVGQLSSKSGKY
jgi:hypothetical protein